MAADTLLPATILGVTRNIAGDRQDLNKKRSSVARGDGNSLPPITVITT